MLVQNLIEFSIRLKSIAISILIHNSSEIFLFRLMVRISWRKKTEWI